jgi:hypothetical protein
VPDEQHSDWAMRTGLLAVDALPDDERQAAEEHARTCVRCQQDLVELREVTSVSREETTQPSPELGDRVVAAVRRSRRRDGLATRSRWAVGAAAAAVALLAAGSLLPSAFDAPREDVELVAADADVRADGALVAHSWGTEIEMVIDGLPADQTYTVEFVDRSGTAFPAGAFLGADRPVVCEMNAALLRPDAALVRVLDDDGDAVLTAIL